MDVFKTLILDTPTVEGATGTVTSVDLTAGTGISVSGGPITSSGSITVTNTAPDQTVALTGGTGISTSGTYPNFTITNDAPDQTVSIASGTGISATGTYPNFTVTNSAPDQTVSIASGTGINVTGTYPNFTVTNSSPSLGGDVVGPASSTDNGIVRFDGTTGKLVQDSSSVVIDDSGNVGIGTSSPANKLHVEGSGAAIAATDSAVGTRILSSNAASAGFVETSTNHPLLFRTNQTERMRIDTSGRVGIGKSPNYSLDVQGVIQAGDGTYGLQVGTGWGGTSTNTYLATNGASTQIVLGINGSEKMRIDSSGNVGIGTTSPATKLEVVGDVTASGTGNKTLKVATTSNAYSYLTMNAWDLDRAQLRAETYSGGGSGSGGGVLSMWTGNTSGTMTQRMTIDGAGNVGINKTPNTSAKLDVLGSSAGAYYGTQTYGPVYYAKEDNTDNVGRGIFNFLRGSTLVGQIVTTNTTCAYNNVSDYRLKEITGPVVDSGKFIDGLKPKVGTWKSTGEKFVGFVAHEFAEVSPSSVTGEKDAVDADGNPVYQSMQASTPEVMANLIAELQSLRARVAELEAKA